MKRKVNTAFGTKGSFIDWYNVTSAFRISNQTSRYFNLSTNFAIYNQYEKNGTPVVMTTPVGHYRACAVVGNSGILRDGGCGDDIDRNDFVIRVNDAPLKTFEQDVGEKTNMTIINSRVLDKMDRVDFDPQWIISRNNSIMSYILGNHRNLKLPALNTMIRKLDLNITMTYSVTPPRPHVKTFWNENFNSKLSDGVTTAGLNTYTLASTFCDVITLYGFYPYQTDVHNKTVYYHYFDETPMEMTVNRSIHDFFHQHELLKSLHDSGALKLVTDECK
ncbi:PREDICTED: alpha-2,8-sialyltransferase 8B-like [Branchiostoma belcheri]|uniref:Alpha-2,8-sialyltransferase 8B-like n=1 Tax=Branchiostoma belcheri TaxID=7741 RepID=A0A6P4Y989_BRABE|nr:PREDICTED: alpha-2,8-sialyltransferase 8B-like [Branchiostoma belcheri]